MSVSWNDVQITTSPSLKYAHLERERRFLLAAVPDHLEAERTSSIRDRYLSQTRLRLRLVERTGMPPAWKLGQKVRAHESSPALLAHTTVYLNAAEAAALLTLPGAELTKTRGILSHQGHQVAVDVFHGHLDGLVLAEVDLGEGRPMPETLPVVPVAEVTDDERFTGGALAVTSTAVLHETLAAYGIG